MTDYTHGTGAAGTMLIRDNGGTIEFHIRSAYTATWGSAIPWNYYINGSSWSGTFSYSTGAAWKHLGTWSVSWTQDVKFGLGATGTSGFGGPTDFWQRINRATVPDAPTPLGVDQETHTTLRYRFSGNGNGGSAIDQWEIHWGPSGSLGGAGNINQGSGGTTTVTGLKPGEDYYFWSRGHNGVGWGPWSSRSSGRTLAGIWIKYEGTWKPAVPYVRVGGVWTPVIVYVRSAGIWKVVG